MFPKNIKFVSTPSRLQQAVDSLPEPKGRVRSTASSDNALRSKLLQIDTEQLRQWKLKPAMLKLIPALAREQRNAVLQEKVLAIVVTSLENMDASTMMELIPLYWQNQEFRLALNAHFVRKPPSGEHWLKTHYKAFRHEHPPQHIAQELSAESPLHRLHQVLKMQTSNPLFVDICKSYTDRLDVSHVQTWSWVQLLSFLKSGYPLSVRQRVFEWVLVEYIGEKVSLEQVLESEELSALLSINLLPKQRRQKLPQHLNLLLHGVKTHQSLAQWLSGTELRQWEPLLSLVQSILVHRPSGLLCVSLDGHVVIWPMSKRDNTISILSLSDFRQHLQSKLRQPIPVAISHVAHLLYKGTAWTEELLEYQVKEHAAQDEASEDMEFE